jgi:hypothetical protein
MVAVIGFVTAAAVSVAIVWLAAGRDHAVRRDSSVDLAEIAGRHVTILGGLAGFAVTGMVLLVTLGRNIPDASGTSFTTLLTMFFVAYVGFLGTSFMFANVTESEATTGFDVPAAMFAGATITQFFTIAIGWFALRPLFETFGLPRLAELAGWLVAASSVTSFALIATQLLRSGVASPRITLVIAVVGAAATSAYAVLAVWFGWRSPESTLALVVGAFGLGVPAYGLVAALPILARQERTASRLAAYGPRLLLAYAQGAVVFVGFLLLAVLGLA